MSHPRISSPHTSDRMRRLSRVKNEHGAPLVASVGGTVGRDTVIGLTPTQRVRISGLRNLCTHWIYSLWLLGAQRCWRFVGESTRVASSSVTPMLLGAGPKVCSRNPSLVIPRPFGGKGNDLWYVALESASIISPHVGSQGDDKRWQAAHSRTLYRGWQSNPNTCRV